MATTSESHSAADERLCVDRFDGRQLEHEVGDHRSEAAADHLGDDVEPGVAGGDRAEQAVDDGDDRVEVGARDGAEHEDQPDQRPGGRRCVLEQLEADVAGRESAGHDPRTDHRDDQQGGAERLGGEPPGEVEAEPAGAGLDLGGEVAVGGVELVAHAAAGTSTIVPMRSRSSATRIVERGLGAGGDRVGDRPVQPGVGGVELLVGLVADRDHQSRQPSTSRGVRGRLRQVEPRPSRSRHGAGMHPLGRMGAGRRRPVGRWSAARGRQRVGCGPSWRCTRTTPDRPGLPAGAEALEGGGQMDVTSATIAARSGPLDQADVLEDVEVVGEQVRFEAEQAAQLDRGPVRHRQLVGDRQPGRVAERGMPRRTHLQAQGRVHGRHSVTRRLLSQSRLSVAGRGRGLAWVRCPLPPQLPPQLDRSRRSRRRASSTSGSRSSTWAWARACCSSSTGS